LHSLANGGCEKLSKFCYLQLSLVGGRMLKTHAIVLVTMSQLISMVGCDDRATQIAREGANRQAQQNTVITELNKEVTIGSRQLVEADAKARQSLIGVHHDLEAERVRLDQGWSRLEDERREISGERRTESMLVAIAKLGGGGIVALVSLALCWFVLVALRTDNAPGELHEFVVGELLSDSRTFIATEASPQLPHDGGGAGDIATQ
jgi:hypothetical protein